MSGNYDYPPASSRRPSRPSGSAEPSGLSERYPRTQQLIEALTSQGTTFTSQDDPVLDTLLSELRFRGDQASASLDQLLDPNTASDQNDETPRESPRSTLRPPPPIGHLDYLRNLIQSESNRANADDTNRALETLNQHIEEHNLDLPRINRTNVAQVDAAAERQIQQLRTDIDSRHTSLIDQLRAERNRHRRSSPSPLPNQEPYPPISRTLRRRSFRPDLRGISTLNETLPTPSLMPQPAHTGRDGRGRQKRRKLETDDNREGMRGFNYGQYGQVVPGALKMEIASCDGGNWDPGSESSFPENVLRNDQTVYCTGSDRCNLVLRHRGEAPFCLKKIVIKAPRTGFDSPIQEGMVFVSMTSDELLARTAQYQIQYSSARRRRRPRRTGLQPSQEYLHAFRSPLQSLERTVLMGPDSNTAPEEDEPTDRNANSPQAEFRVTTEYDEISEENVFIDREDEDEPSITELERIQEDDLLCSDTDESVSDDDDNDDSTMSTFHRRRLELQRRIGNMRPQYSDPTSRRRQPPSLVDPLPPQQHTTSGSNGATHGTADAEVMKPHARFFIEREKSMVSIKFDPPPSGRFILIKLWSPRSDGNIDIQSVIAHGYAGPRYFPSGGFR
ncbi:uncharacterized protein N7443_009343 [Penicillium atrosanguineum]|uniref:Uncharacterized protein n=1 Tax=Penicillium atrosanguineum TaxID=1132637 RepID=A0A9W9PN79_9EURO|nr:uncharacterized protein N7443_009343 [Penicillium atrosanguineum]KAJ5293390.1 hypothetical protein N7443_009343 [Penicillium atrosanguineum]KAJ5302575.1 hypothetical protein N7476_009374 [Penicillium atrosanguineum]